MRLVTPERRTTLFPDWHREPVAVCLVSWSRAGRTSAHVKLNPHTCLDELAKLASMLAPGVEIVALPAVGADMWSWSPRS